MAIWLKEDCRLVVVNLSAARSQGRVRLTGVSVPDRGIEIEDLFSSAICRRDGREILESGLFVDLPPWGHHFFRFRSG